MTDCLPHKELTAELSKDLLSVHCSLLTAHCPLLSANCSLLSAHCPLITAHWSIIPYHLSMITDQCRLQLGLWFCFQLNSLLNGSVCWDACLTGVSSRICYCYQSGKSLSCSGLQLFWGMKAYLRLIYIPHSHQALTLQWSVYLCICLPPSYYKNINT